MKSFFNAAPMTVCETKAQRKRLSIYIWASIALAAACGTCAEICVLLAYDPQLNYFVSSPLVYLLYGMIALSVIFAASALLTLKADDDKGHIYNEGIASKISMTSPLPALGAILYAGIRTYVSGNTVLATLGKREISLGLILILLSLISALYFICSGLMPKLHSGVKMAFGIVAMLALGISAIEAYFEYRLEMNSPAKLFMQFSAVLGMLYIASELRFAIGNPRPRRHFIFTAVASTLCAISPVVYITLYIKGRVDNLIYLALNIWIMTILVYMVEKMLKLVSARPLSEVEQELAAMKPEFEYSDSDPEADSPEHIDGEGGNESEKTENTDNQSTKEEDV